MKKYSILLIISILTIMLIAGCGGGGGSTGVIPNNGSVNTIDPTATPGTLVEVPGNPTATPGSTIPSNLPTGTFKVEVQFPGSGSGLRAKDLAGSDLPYNSHTLRVTITGEAIATSIVGERNDLDPTGAGTYTLTVSNVPVGLNTATIEVLDPSGNLLCQRKHGFYMTPGATEGPGLILLGVAIQGDGSYVPQNIDIPQGSSISFQNHDYTNDRTASMNSGAVTVGPIGHATHITQPVTAEVFPAINNLFNTQGQFDYDGQTGRVLVYGLPTLTSVTPDKDSTNGTSSVSFTLTGNNFGTSQASVNGAVRFIQVNESDPNNPWGTVYNPSSFASWSNTSIAGSINLPYGKYRIEVSVRGENTTETVFFYKGTGTYQVIVGDSELLNLAEDFTKTTNTAGENLLFGYKVNLSDNTLNLFTQYGTFVHQAYDSAWHEGNSNGHVWKNTSTGTINGIPAGEVGLHPGDELIPAGGHYTVIRWKSTFSGNINMSGTFGQGDTGEVDLYITKNNNTASPLFARLASSNDEPFNINSAIVPGDYVDFITGNAGTWGADSTPLTLTIKVQNLAEIYNWTEHNGHYYALTDVEGSWQDTESEAQSTGGHLVTINTEEENNWIVSQFGSTIYWIGLYQPTSGPEPDGGWEWVSGEPVSYTIWVEPPYTEPNDNEGVEDWVTINFWDTGHWNDEPLTGFNSTHKGIIELNQAP